MQRQAADNLEPVDPLNDDEQFDQLIGQIVSLRNEKAALLWVWNITANASCDLSEQRLGLPLQSFQNDMTITSAEKINRLKLEVSNLTDEIDSLNQDAAIKKFKEVVAEAVKLTIEANMLFHQVSSMDNNNRYIDRFKADIKRLRLIESDPTLPTDVKINQFELTNHHLRIEIEKLQARDHELSSISHTGVTAQHLANYPITQNNNNTNSAQNMQPSTYSALHLFSKPEALTFPNNYVSSTESSKTRLTTRKL